MVDTYDKNAENRKKFKKNHGDGEDPIIIAQRFLNIFRQLHIFSKERKEAFNKMILEQPPEIRGMFSSLPGGSLLQEYVDDLEQSVGVVRDHSAEFTQDTTSPELKEELSKAKILATALAEAQAQANARIQSMPEQPAFAPQATATSVMSGNVKVVADSSFAKEIAAAFSQALKYSEEKTQIGNKQLAAAVIASQEKMAKVFAEKTDTTALTKSLIESQEKMAQALADNALALQKLPIKSLGGGKETSFVSANGSNQEILDAIRESQDRMAQMIMQHNNLAASNSSNNNANNIQINTTPMPPVEDMVKGIVKAQSELFKEMARTQTKELSAIISVALKESQQLSSKTIAEAIEKVQRENRKFFEVHSKDFSLSSVKQTDQEKESNNSLHRIPSSFDEKEDFQIPEVNPSSEDDEFAELFSGKNVVKPDDQEDITDSVSHDISSEENITEILENEEKITKSLNDDEFYSLSKFVPSINKQKENIALRNLLYKNELKNYAVFLKSCYIDKLLEGKNNNEFLTADELSKIKEGFLIDDKTSVIVLKNADLKKVKNANIIDLKNDISRYVKLCRENCLKLLIPVIFILYIGLSFAYGFKGAYKTALPSILGGFFSIGILGLFNQDINLFHTLSLFLIAGFSLDYSIFRYSSKDKSKETRGAVLISCATSVFSFLLLSLTSFKLISSLGFILAFGLTSAYIFSILLIDNDDGTNKQRMV